MNHSSQFKQVTWSQNILDGEESFEKLNECQAWGEISRLLKMGKKWGHYFLREKRCGWKGEAGGTRLYTCLPPFHRSFTFALKLVCWNSCSMSLAWLLIRSDKYWLTVVLLLSLDGNLVHLALWVYWVMGLKSHRQAEKVWLSAVWNSDMTQHLISRLFR